MIGQLSSDRGLIGKCPVCEETRPLGKWNLFAYGEFPDDAANCLSTLLEKTYWAEDDYKHEKLKFTSGAARRFIEVQKHRVIRN
jgi:hypothetical protein